MRYFSLIVIAALLTWSSSVYAQTTEIYVSDAGNFQNPPWQILKFDENGSNPEVFISENMTWPQDILFLEDRGIVLISNFSPGRITKHDATTGAYLGLFAGSIGAPTRMKIGKDSLLYVLQWGGNGKVWRYQLDGTFVDEFTSFGVPQSIGLDWDASGNLYVSSYNGDYVRKFDTSGTDLGNFISSNLLGPTNIWFDTNGDLLVLDYNGTSVKRFDSDGLYQGDFISGLGKGEGVAYLPNGNILIGNGATRSVKMFSSNGTYISDLVASGAGGLLTPNAVFIRQLNVTSVSEGDAGTVPEKISILAQNYPNPFNPSTTIAYTTHHPGHVRIAIYNTLGEKVHVIDEGFRDVGSYTRPWTSSHPSGVYVYQLQFTDKTGVRTSQSRKMLLLR